MSLIWTCLKRYRWLFLAAVTVVLLEANCELLLPLLMARMIDEGVRAGDLDQVLRLGGAMAAAAAAGILCVLIRNVCSGIASQKFGADLRRVLYERILRLSEESVGRVGAGSLITRTMNDSDQLSKFVNSIARIGVKAPVLCVGSILYAMSLDPALSLVVLGVVLVVLALIVWYMLLSDRRFRRVRTAMDRVNTVVQEFLQGIRLVKAFGREAEEQARFQAANEELTDSAVRQQVLSAWFSPLIALAVNLGIVAVLCLAGERMAAAGKVSAILTYMTQLLGALMTLIDVFKAAVRAHTSTERIQEVLSLPMEQEPEQPASVQDVGALLAFERVTFAYPGGSGVPALRELSFQLERGKTLAVVGPTGSGKSTLAWLCVRLYDPQEGCIRLGGRDLQELSLEQARRNVALVPQQSGLFGGSVRENLAMGDPEAGDEQMYVAAETARADGFVRAMEQSYDSPVGQGGVNLSGGQRQRLSLARALLRNAGLLILDDCTSALDALTEQEVLAGLERNTDCARLLITQRMRTARTADAILVLENGRQAGMGTHAALLESCPIYREMWSISCGEESGDD